jgi:hypothetical protein
MARYRRISVAVFSLLMFSVLLNAAVYLWPKLQGENHANDDLFRTRSETAEHTTAAAAHEIEQYEFVKANSNDLMEVCVHASIVAGAYRRALDENNYRYWKAIEQRDCRWAGIRR